MTCPSGCRLSDPFGMCRDCIRRIERERVLKLIEHELHEPPNYSQKIRIAEVIDRIRRGEL
jgi:hypothetical protein